MGIFCEFTPALLQNVDGVSYVGRPKNRTMMYLSKKLESQLSCLAEVSDCLVFLEKTIKVPDELSEKHVFILCTNPSRAYTECALTLAERIDREFKKKKYHNDNGYWMGENVTLGNEVTIEPGVFVDHDVRIGDRAVIKSGARIRRNTWIGADSIVSENCVIGENAFNLTKWPDGSQSLIPCFGKVIMGKHVYIGPGTVISRGSADDTVLEDDVKVGALVHLGHDVWIKQGTVLRSACVIGGYCSIERDSVIAINATIKNRLHIGENCFIGMGSVVHHNLREGMDVSGSPAKSLEMIGKERYLYGQVQQLLRQSMNQKE